MATIPQIALFRSESSEHDQLVQLLQRYQYVLHQVGNLAELTDLVVNQQIPVQVVIIPLRLGDGSSGVTTCLHLKSSEQLSSIPVLGLTGSSERTVLQSFFEVGADVVMRPPLDADMLYFQLVALSRRSGHPSTPESPPTPEAPRLSDSLLTAFNNMREALLLFGPNRELTFANEAARIGLALDHSPTPEEIQAVEETFLPFIEKHDQALIAHRGVRRKQPYKITLLEASLARADRQSFRAAIKVVTLEDGTGARAGEAVIFTDFSELDQLSNTLMQSQRTRSLCLITAAKILESLTSTGGGIVVSPLLRIEESIAQEPRESALSSTITSLLEFVDLVISPNIVIKVNLQRDEVVALRRSDLFQLMGHMVLHAIEHAGKKGEALITVGDYTPGRGLPIVITSKAQKVTPLLPNDRLSSLIRGDASMHASNSDDANKLSYGLTAAQEIAERYRANIEYQSTSEQLFKVRVHLPITSKSASAQ